jgi:alkylhydroperoxidase family enzyme
MSCEPPSVRKTSRLDPLPAEHSPELKEEFDSFLRTLGFVPNSVLTMQRKPRLAKAFVGMQRALWDPESKVDRGLKRLVAHIASRVAADPYSMAHTASGALHFGVAPEKLAAMREYRTSDHFTPAERAALDFAVAASATPNAADEKTFAVLLQHWSEEEIVEIAGVVAMAGFLSRWNVSMATPLEREPLEVAEKYLAPHGWDPGVHRRS